MIEEINCDSNLWADMEIGLGNFTAKIDNAQEFENFYYVLSEILQEYLKNEIDRYYPAIGLRNKIINDLIVPEKYLKKLDKIRFESAVKHDSDIDEISIITLNYTNTLEKILKSKVNPLLGPIIEEKNPSVLYNDIPFLKNIIHLHGELGNTIILGVDNEDQIANEKFKANDDLKDFLVKIESNRVMKETRHLECENLIKDANIIVLFGLSLGKTDDRWWKLIGQNLKDREDILIIQHIYSPYVIKETQLTKIGSIERAQKNVLKDRMEINDEIIKNKVFFTVNEPIFKI